MLRSGDHVLIVTLSFNSSHIEQEPEPEPESIAIFTTTMRGKEQLLYLGQPFVFEKLVVTQHAQPKKIWRCNQWWNQKCRARVYTLGNVITPLNRYHTHSDIVKRKRRVTKKKAVFSTSGDKGGPGKSDQEQVTSYVVNVDLVPVESANCGDQKKLELTDY